MSRPPRPVDRHPDAASGAEPPGHGPGAGDANGDPDPWDALRARRPRIGPAAPKGLTAEDRRRRVDAVRAVLRDRRTAPPRRTSPRAR